MKQKLEGAMRGAIVAFVAIGIVALIGGLFFGVAYVIINETVVGIMVWIVTVVLFGAIYGVIFCNDD